MSCDSSSRCAVHVASGIGVYMFLSQDVSHPAVLLSRFLSVAVVLAR